MIYGLTDLKRREVINVLNGEKLGFIDDIEFDSQTGRVAGFVIMGQSRFWGFLGKDEDIVLSVNEIELIGKDTILVRYNETLSGGNKRKKFVFENLFEKNKKNT